MESGGNLTSNIRGKSFSLSLLHEVEKVPDRADEVPSASPGCAGRTQTPPKPHWQCCFPASDAPAQLKRWRYWGLLGAAVSLALIIAEPLR